MFGKIGELLSDEESVKQLTELAQMLMTGDSENNEENTEKCSDNENESSDEKSGSLFSGFDIGSLMKLTEIAGSFNKSDKNSELLIALKPHLREDKQQKVDKAIKLLKLLALWNVFKESGLLKDFLQ